jgi:hypothetical protein
MGLRARAASLGFAALCVLGAPSADAQGKPKPAPRAQKAKPTPAPKKAPDVKKTPDEPAATETKPEAPAGAPEGTVKAAGTTSKTEKAGSEAKVTSVEESAKDKGVKTYKFSAVEVEGRLKSPQIVYFLRRVRAEFEAGALGHRSFMPELSDSRRSPALK